MIPYPYEPPTAVAVLDRHGGFTAIMRSGDSCWRPGSLAKRGTVGTLIDGSVKKDDFYQQIEPVVSALYKLPGYPYPIKIWWHFDGRRIA